jgi:hypothetical protein
MTQTLKNTAQNKPRGRSRTTKIKDAAHDNLGSIMEGSITFTERARVTAEYDETPDVYVENSASNQSADLALTQRLNDGSLLFIEMPSAGIDPLRVLPLGSHFSVPKLMDHCMPDYTIACTLKLT